MNQTAKSENGSPIPGAGNEGNGKAANYSGTSDEKMIACPECGCTRLEYGSHDPLEGWAFWCQGCGFGPVWVEDPRVVYTAGKVVDAEELQKIAQAAATVDRQDEPLATFRWQGMDIIEVPYTPPKNRQIADLAAEARARLKNPATGRGLIDDMLLQIQILADGV